MIVGNYLKKAMAKNYSKIVYQIIGAAMEVIISKNLIFTPNGLFLIKKRTRKKKKPDVRTV